MMPKFNAVFEHEACSLLFPIVRSRGYASPRFSHFFALLVPFHFRQAYGATSFCGYSSATTVPWIRNRRLRLTLGFASSEKRSRRLFPRCFPVAMCFLSCPPGAGNHSVISFRRF